MINDTFAILPFVLVVFIITIGVVLLNLHFQKNLYNQKLAQEKLNAFHQTELLRSSIDAQEEERKRIAQDLHDELGAVLSIIRMHLKVIEETGINENNLQQSKTVENVRQLAETALATVRTISHQLMPPQLEKFGLIKTLEAVINQINSTNKILIQLTTTNKDAILNWDINLGLYRIIMELMNNTIKHAAATKIDLHINFSTNSIDCTYADNGIGIDLQKNNPGLGLKSIEGRVAALNGKITYGNIIEGQGFFANLQIPL